MTDWWTGLAAAQATVNCAGEQHRIRWEAGSLSALDHGDVDNERALAALGGQRCTCIDLLDAWERHDDDVRVLVLATRGPTDRLATTEDDDDQQGMPRQVMMARRGAMARAGRGRARRSSGMGRGRLVQAGWTAYGPSGRESKHAESENELTALLGLGGALPDRLAASVAASWRERLASRDRTVTRVLPQLQAALHGRVFAAVRLLLGETELRTELTMIAEHGEPTLSADDGIVRAELPFGWLVDVWAKDLTVTWGRFCLAATSEDGRTWHLTTVAPDFGPPASVLLQLPSAD